MKREQKKSELSLRGGVVRSALLRVSQRKTIRFGENSAQSLRDFAETIFAERRSRH
jgi:hypothetical protein